MPTNIYFISNVVNIAANILVFIISLLYCYRRGKPRYLRLFPIYLAVSIAVELLVNSFMTTLWHFQPFGSYQDRARNVIYNLWGPFELYIFSCFLFRISHSKIVRTIFAASILLYGIYFLAYAVGVGLSKETGLIAIVMENITFILPCSAWYWSIFAVSKSIDLPGDPAFWLVTGILFYAVAIIPYFLIAIYCTRHGLDALCGSLYCINNFSLVVTYILFIKGFTCRANILVNISHQAQQGAAGLSTPT
jgi:hypothetical protein